MTPKAEERTRETTWYPEKPAALDRAWNSLSDLSLPPAWTFMTLSRIEAILWPLVVVGVSGIIMSITTTLPSFLRDAWQFFKI